MASFKPNGGQLEGAGKSEGPKLNDLNKSPWENDRILIDNDIIPFCDNFRPDIPGSRRSPERVWCGAPSHRLFCTTSTERSIFARLLIGLTNRLLFMIVDDLSSRLS